MLGKKVYMNFIYTLQGKYIDEWHILLTQTKYHLVEDKNVQRRNISVKKPSESGCGRETARKNVFTLYHISLLSLFSFTSFFTGAPATWDAVMRGKSLTREDPPRLGIFWWKRNKDDDYYFSALWGWVRALTHFPMLARSLPHRFLCRLTLTTAISQNQTQKTAQLSIQSCNCLLKLIKIARLATLLLVNSGSSSPVPQSFLNLLSSQSLLV